MIHVTCFLLVTPRTPQTGLLTHQQWLQIQKRHADGILTKTDTSQMTSLDILQKKLHQQSTRWGTSSKKHQRGSSKRKLQLKGKKRLSKNYKHNTSSSSSSSEYYSSTSSSSTSDSDLDPWDDGCPLTPSQELNWTQFIAKMCNKSPVDPICPINKDD